MDQILIEVWGKYACFTRPDLKVERMSYPVPTPSAVIGILDSILWHPAMWWQVNSIQVCNPIRYIKFRMNEQKQKAEFINAKAIASAKTIEDKVERFKNQPLFTGEPLEYKFQTDQRTTTALRDVRYVISASIGLKKSAPAKDTLRKFYEMAVQRIDNGQNYYDVCLGLREFAANFKLCEQPPQVDDSLKGDIDLGFMFYGFDWRALNKADNFSQEPNDKLPKLYFHPIMRDGLITVPSIGSEGIYR